MIFLMYISFLFIIIAEILYEIVNGDKHDFISQVRLFTFFLVAQIFGLVGGINYGFLVYGLIRLSIFDLIFAKVFVGDWFFTGTTSKWDKLISKIPECILTTIRIISIITSIIIIL